MAERERGIERESPVVGICQVFLLLVIEMAAAEPLILVNSVCSSLIYLNYVHNGRNDESEETQTRVVVTACDHLALSLSLIRNFSKSGQKALTLHIKIGPAAPYTYTVWTVTQWNVSRMYIHP